MEHLLGLLRVRVVRGTNLAVRDIRSSDPYVVVKMGKQVTSISLFMLLTFAFPALLRFLNLWIFFFFSTFKFHFFIFLLQTKLLLYTTLIERGRVLVWDATELKRTILSAGQSTFLLQLSSFSVLVLDLGVLLL